MFAGIQLALDVTSEHSLWPIHDSSRILQTHGERSCRMFWWRSSVIKSTYLVSYRSIILAPQKLPGDWRASPLSTLIVGILMHGENTPEALFTECMRQQSHPERRFASCDPWNQTCVQKNVVYLMEFLKNWNLFSSMAAVITRYINSVGYGRTRIGIKTISSPSGSRKNLSSSSEKQTEYRYNTEE